MAFSTEVRVEAREDRTIWFVTGSQEGAQHRDGTTDITRTIANRHGVPVGRM